MAPDSQQTRLRRASPEPGQLERGASHARSQEVASVVHLNAALKPAPLPTHAQCNLPGGPSATAAAVAAALPLGASAALQPSALDAEAMPEGAEEAEARRRAMVQELEAMGCRFSACEEELARERALTGQAEAQRAEQGLQADEMQSYATELEQENRQLRLTLLSLEEHCGGAAQAAEALRLQRGAGEEALEREESKVVQLMQELEHLKADFAYSSSGAVSGADGASESPEVRLLRAELAKRDRELLAATAARRRTAEQSERVATALRAKLTELEAAVAATPSTSSRASSLHRSDHSDRGAGASERGSPYLLQPPVDKAVQTESDADARGQSRVAALNGFLASGDAVAPAVAPMPIPTLGWSSGTALRLSGATAGGLSAACLAPTGRLVSGHVPSGSLPSFPAVGHVGLPVRGPSGVVQDLRRG